MCVSSWKKLIDFQFMGHDEEFISQNALIYPSIFKIQPNGAFKLHCKDHVYTLNAHERQHKFVVKVGNSGFSFFVYNKIG